MYTILISLFSSSFLAFLTYYFLKDYNYALAFAIILGVLSVIAFNFFIGKHFLKKLTDLFKSVEKDLQHDRAENAIKKLTEGYKFANWQLFVKEQINSQIGIIYYSKKKFDKAKPYLEKPFSKNWMAMSMLATMQFKESNLDATIATMNKAIKNSPKEGFLYSLYAYFLMTSNMKDKAVEILQNGYKKLPLDEKISANLSAVQNNKKIKMQNYGTLWLQLHLSKTPQGAKPYQMLLMNQRFKRQ